MLSQKSQASLEFLMTYGWAILVVLAAIGALAYFGVLSPDKFLPEKCTIAPGIDCAGFKVETSSITLVLRNGMGKDLTISEISIESSVAGTCKKAFNTTFENGAMKTFVIDGCSNGNSGDRYKGDILITYTESMTGLTKTTDGSLTGKIQPTT